MLAARYTARSLLATQQHLATESQASSRREGQVTWQLMPEEHINDLTPEEHINDNYTAHCAPLNSTGAGGVPGPDVLGVDRVKLGQDQFQVK